MEVTLDKFNEVITALEAGQLRVAEKVDGVWQVNKWVKEVILAGFKLGKVVDMSQGQFNYFDKDTFPVQTFSAMMRIASTARKASGIARRLLAESSSVRSNHCVAAVKAVALTCAIAKRASEPMRSLRMGLRL